jgi:hypothetical protein
MSVNDDFRKVASELRAFDRALHHEGFRQEERSALVVAFATATFNAAFQRELVESASRVALEQVQELYDRVDV